MGMEEDAAGGSSDVLDPKWLSKVRQRECGTGGGEGAAWRRSCRLQALREAYRWRCVPTVRAMRTKRYDVDVESASADLEGGIPLSLAIREDRLLSLVCFGREIQVHEHACLRDADATDSFRVGMVTPPPPAQRDANGSGGGSWSRYLRRWEGAQWLPRRDVARVAAFRRDALLVYDLERDPPEAGLSNGHAGGGEWLGAPHRQLRLLNGKRGRLTSMSVLVDESGAAGLNSHTIAIGGGRGTGAFAALADMRSGRAEHSLLYLALANTRVHVDDWPTGVLQLNPFVAPFLLTVVERGALQHHDVRMASTCEPRPPLRRQEGAPTLFSVDVPGGGPSSFLGYTRHDERDVSSVVPLPPAAQPGGHISFAMVVGHGRRLQVFDVPLRAIGCSPGADQNAAPSRERSNEWCCRWSFAAGDEERTSPAAPQPADEQLRESAAVRRRRTDAPPPPPPSFVLRERSMDTAAFFGDNVTPGAPHALQRVCKVCRPACSVYPDGQTVHLFTALRKLEQDRNALYVFDVSRHAGGRAAVDGVPPLVRRPLWCGERWSHSMFSLDGVAVESGVESPAALVSHSLAQVPFCRYPVVLSAWEPRLRWGA
ncbi:hypothetical protein CDCA_CDCA08G2559 [Cyanidium caldarium]|uniref:DUF1618 domain-containing protein n=1 Tax=Cyanidium caldarium TaxID=2771 RepID=A0AAV9IW83_CYACA|nr:hypothetical protein CDCA_CDCA08G2559 [Cyanidium caldarium]